MVHEVVTKGALAFGTIPSILIPYHDYKNNRTHRISFPKEQTLCFSENRIADVTKIKAMRPRKSRYAMTDENYQKNTITGYSVFFEETAIP